MMRGLSITFRAVRLESRKGPVRMAISARSSIRSMMLSESAVDIERAVRAFNPVPGAWFEVNGERVKLLAADVIEGTGKPGEVLDDQFTIATGDGAIRSLQVQRAGRAPMSAGELLRGFVIPKGTILP